MRDFPNAAKPLYWALTALVTLLIFYIGIAYEDPLWELLIPLTVAVLGALTIDRSWRGVSIVLGVTLLMCLVYCLRHYGPY